jgi:hypothetical protein
MQKVWEEDETSADGLREKWEQVEILEDALIGRVLQAKDIRLGTARTDSIYYQAMKSIVPVTWLRYMWRLGTTMAGMTEEMINTRINISQASFPQQKILRDTREQRVTYVPFATGIRIVVTMQLHGAQESCPWCKLSTILRCGSLPRQSQAVTEGQTALFTMMGEVPPSGHSPVPRTCTGQWAISPPSCCPKHSYIQLARGQISFYIDANM